MRELRWLDELDHALEDVTERLMLARWDELTHHDGASVAALQEERARLLADPDVQRRLAAPLGAADLTPRDRRRLETLERLVLDSSLAGQHEIAALAEEIQGGAIVPFRPVLDGAAVTRTEVIQRLRLDPDRARRREAARALEPLGEKVAPLVRRLAKLRNRQAQALGFADFPAARAHVERTDPAWLAATLAEVERRTAPLWREVLGRMREVLGHEPTESDWRFGLERLAGPPSDEHFPRDRHGERTRSLCRAVGFDERTRDIELRIEDIPYGGLEMPIRIPEDVRILVNPPDGFAGLHTVVHEFGHCLHARYNEQRGDLLQRNEPGHFNEAVAEIVGHLVLRPEYLEADADLDEPARRAAVARATRFEHGRTLLATVELERALYADPDADLNAAAGEITRRVAGLEPVTTHFWAADAFLVEYPLYRHSYLISRMVGAQASAAFTARYGRALGEPRVARDLIEHVYAPGNSLDWQTKIERLTGSPLGVDAWIRELEVGAAL